MNSNTDKNKKRNLLLNRILLSKESGDSSIVSSIIIVVITLVVFVLCMLLYISFQGQVEKQFEVDLVVHKYMTKLETIDYSDSAEAADIFNLMKTELASKGMTDIDFSGSSTGTVPSGGQITLHVTGKLKSYGIQLGSGLFDASGFTKTWAVDVRKSGTAMY